MNVDIIIKDGGVCIVLSPENDMEKEVLKTVSRQDNSITEVRSPLPLLTKTIKDSIIIAGKSANLVLLKENTDGDN